MVTSLGTVFSTDENVVVQANLKLLRSMVESLIIEFDQEKFEEFLSSGSVSPKVSSETRSQLSSETSQREAHMLFDRASGSTSLEDLTTSRGANMACDNVSQEICKASVLAHSQHSGGRQSHRQTPPEAQQTQCARSSQQHLQAKRIVDRRRRRQARHQQKEAEELLALNVKLAFSLAFLQQKCDACVHELRVSAPKRKVRAQSQVMPNARYASHFKNARPAFNLRPCQNATFAFQF